MIKAYIGTLRIDGKKQAEVTSGKKELVADIIIHYLYQDLDEDGEEYQVTIKCNELEIGDE